LLVTLQDQRLSPAFLSSSELQVFGQQAMSSTVNEPSSCLPTTSFRRTARTRTLSVVNAKPVLVRTSHTKLVVSDHTNHLCLSSLSNCLHSTASLSSTGYESNSSTSMTSKRDSLTNNHSRDLSLSSNDEGQRWKSSVSFHTSNIHH
jgi:hypothetical protein